MLCIWFPLRKYDSLKVPLQSTFKVAKRIIINVFGAWLIDLQIYPYIYKYSWFFIYKSFDVCALLLVMGIKSYYSESTMVGLT